MKVGLLGTGFGLVHASIYHRHPEVDEVVVFGRTPAKLEKMVSDFGFATTTDIETIFADASIDLVDVCLPTPLHADHVIRSLDAGKHVLCELPLASTLADAQRIVDAHADSDRKVFVDMFGRFDPAKEFLRGAIADRRYGALKTLDFATRSALLWEGYDVRLDSIVMDLMHANLDAIVLALGLPQSMSAAGVGKDGRGSAVDVVFTYPDAIASCCGSALMPRPYGVRGGWRAAFTDAVLESNFTAGWDGRASTTLTEYTEEGERGIDLPDIDLYTAVIDHVIASLHGRATSRISPDSTLDSLQVTLDVHHAVNPRS